MRVLGLDLGTSFIKGAVLDLDALAILHVERLPFPSPRRSGNPAFSEFDPNLIVATTRTLLESLSDKASDAKCVVVCSQLHGLVLCDEKGRALGNFINWQDERTLLPIHPDGRTYFEEINARLTPVERQSLGNEARPGMPLCFLFWLAHNKLLPGGHPIAASLPNYVIANLCGGRPKSEITHAYGHGAFDLETDQWHSGVIQKLGLDIVDWPAIVPQGEILGQSRIGSRNLAFFAPVGDYQCAQAGTLLQEGELSINISTGSGVAMLGPRLEFGNFQTRPFFDERILRAVTHIPGGRALNALIRLLGELAEAQGHELENPWDYILAAASRVKKTDLRVNPAFYFSAVGERGAITNVREQNLTVGDLFYATFTAMAENYSRCALRVSPEAEWQRVVFSGGVALKAELLRRLICDRLGAAHRIVASEEDTMLGLLALALAFNERAASVQKAMNFLRLNYQPTSQNVPVLQARSA
jgi:sugar (pentulose or hexulose) kinase